MTPAERLARAVILFHRGGPWGPADRAAWEALTGTTEATTVTLCDLARRTDGEIDHRDLLRRYIRHVDENEGATHIGDWDRRAGSKRFTAEERAELERLQDAPDA